MAKAKILIVEDERIVVKDIKEILKGLGYVVSAVASSGEEAIRKASETRPDLVLMDIVLKGNIDGIDAAKQIRDSMDIPVVYLTAYADEDTLQRAKMTEPFGYIIKPFEERELYTTVEMALYKHGMERELKESKEWFATTLSSIGDAVISTDNKENITFMNYIAEALTGWPKEDAIGKPIKDVFNIINEETGKKANNIVRRVIEEGKVVGLANHTALIAKEGKIMSIMDSAAPIRTERGDVIGVVLVFKDITEQRGMEQKLRESESKYRKLIEGANDGIIIADAETGVVIEVNKRAEKLLGLPAEKIIGLHQSEIHPKEYREHYKKLFLDHVKSEKAIAEDIFVGHSDGRNIPVEISSSVIEFNGRKVIQGIFHDLTERRRLESFVRNILESVDEGFIVVDRELRILSANKAYSEMVKLPVEDITGKHCYLVSHHNNTPCHEEGEDCAVKHTFETGMPHSVLRSHLDSNGVASYFEIKSFPFKDEKGRIVSAIEIVNDITEKTKLEEQLRHSQKMEAIGTLTGGIAHDFNNILNVIIGYGELIKTETAEDDPLMPKLDEILKAADRAVYLTQGLLSFSRKQAMQIKPLSINEIIDGMKKMLGRIIGEDIELRIIKSDKNMVIMADRVQMDQILMNFATNTRDAMPDGGIFTIRTEMVELDKEFIKAHHYGEPGMYVLLSIADNGKGMDEQTKKKIFEPFFTTKEVGKGTGLGLSIVYGIVKEHKGYINIYSELGKGTTFRIYLPIVESEILKAESTDMTEVKGGAETILLAEDEESVRKLTRVLLEGHGYNVIEASDGEDALKIFIADKDKIQLVILDVIMPKMNGKKAYEEMRKISCDIKAIFMSGFIGDVLDKKGIIQEGLTFIPKPVMPYQLLRKVREVLDK